MRREGREGRKEKKKGEFRQVEWKDKEIRENGQRRRLSTIPDQSKDRFQLVGSNN